MFMFGGFFRGGVFGNGEASGNVKLWNPLATQGQPKYQNIQAGVKKSGVFAIVDSAIQFAIDQIPIGTINSIITFDSDPNIGWRIISTTILQSKYTTPSIVADEATLNSTFPPSEEYNDYYCFVNSTNTYWQCKIFGTDFAWDNTGRQTIDTLSSNEIYDLLQSNSIFDRNRANHEGTQPASTISDFTESAQNAIGNALLDTTTIDLTYNDAANQISANVKDLSLTDSKIATDADISASKIKQTTISPELNPFTNGDTQDVINNKAQGQLNNLENLINTRPIGASNGVVYYLTSQNSPVLDYELLSFSPDNSPLDIESKTINSTTPKASRLIHSYISSYTINRSTINGGNWIFNLYGYASQLNGVSNFQIDVYKRTGTTETLLFSCETSTLLQTTQASPELNVSNVEITQQDFVVNENDYLVIKIFAKTERTQDTIITLLHSGTLYASHIHTPLIISHNQLAEAQGGTATEKYHLQLTDYNKVLNLDNSLATKFSKNIGNEISLLTEKTTVNGNDFGLLEDSEDSNKKKKYKVSAISNYTVAALTPTLDGKVDTTTNQNIGGNKTFSQNITLNAVPSQGTHVIRKNELDNLETSVNNNLNLKTTITNLRQESTRFIEKTYGLDTNNGLTPDKPFKTIETGWNDVNPSGQVKILGGAEYTVNHTFLSTKQSIKTILDSGAKIIGTINLVSGNTSMQFFDGKISATINDASNGTCYFNNVDLSGTTLNFTNGGYKYIANATSSPTLINLPDLSGVTGTLQLSNINGVVPISIGSGWTVIKAITTLSIISKNASSPLFDSNSYYINSVLTTQAQLDAIVTDGLYIVNFANPTGITGLSQGDIIYKVGLIKVIINKFNDAPPSVSVFSAGGAQTWIKQAVSTWVNAVINSANRLPANYIADGSVSNTQFQYLNTTTSNVQTQLNNKLATSLKGAVNGLAELDEFGKVPSAQLPAFVDDVLEFDNLASFPATGETGKIYVAKDTNLTYRWSGTQYVEISASLALGETSSTAYRGDRGKIAYDHSQSIGNPHSTTKGDIGLNNVDNTADINKNVLSATKLTTARNINGVAFDGTANITIVDSTKEPAFTKNTAFNKNFGTTVNTVTEGNDARLGTKAIDETNIGDGKYQRFNSTTNKLEYVDQGPVSGNMSAVNITGATGKAVMYSNDIGTLTTPVSSAAEKQSFARSVSSVASLTTTEINSLTWNANERVYNLTDNLYLRRTVNNTWVEANVRIGTYIDACFETEQYGWYLCNGQSKLISQFPDAYAILGNTSLTDASSFILPNLQGKVAGYVGTGTKKFSFLPTDVNTTIDIITTPNNFVFKRGNAITLTTTGTLPSPLVVGTTYYITNVSASGFGLSTSLANSRIDSDINLNTQGTGIHTITLTHGTRSLHEDYGSLDTLMTSADLAPHTHRMTGYSTSGLGSASANSTDVIVYNGDSAISTLTNLPFTEANTGTTTALNVMQPTYYIGNKFIFLGA